MNIAKKQGFFLSFEGGEGSGKSTQIRLLEKYLKECGIETIVTREPGGSVGAEDIRNLLVQRNSYQWQPLTEVLLLYAARFEHVETVIKPALKKGIWVLCDRFFDSTFAYQGAGHKLTFEQIKHIHDEVLGDFSPDLTLLLDIDPEIGLKRAFERATEKSCMEDKYERLDVEFHHSLRNGYLELAGQAPQRIQIINANQDIESLAQAIKECLQQKGIIDG